LASAPRKTTPAANVGQPHTEINAALADRKFKERLADLGRVANSDTLAEFGSFLVGEIEEWRKVVEFSGTKTE
jgi:hypothetical protein